MFSYARYTHKPPMLISSHTEPLSNDFRLFLFGEEVPVYVCNISKYPFNRVWPGKQRDFDQTEMASFVSLVSDGRAEIEVVTSRPYQKIHIKPYSKNVGYTIEDNKIRFTLPDNGTYVLWLDTYHRPLYIINSKPIAPPKKSEVTYYFGAGVHFPGKITLKDNDSVYIDKDALVFGGFFAENAKNIKIFGGGLIDGGYEERVTSSCYSPYTNGHFKFYDCQSISIEGIIMRNSAIWCVNVFHCQDVSIDGIKVIGQWRYNTDGIDIVNSKRISIRNSFIHSFDDTISIKGIDRYALTDNEDITVEDCTLWCDWGKACEIGVETACRRYSRIAFRRCDILRGGNTALDVNNGDCAEIDHVVFEDINVDYNACDTVEVYQARDDMVYNAIDTVMIPHLIWIGNRNFRRDESISMRNVPPGKSVGLDLTGIRQAMNHDIAVRNINVYYDEKIPKRDGKYNLPICIKSIYPDIIHENILISNIRVNGKVLKESDALLNVSSVKNFIFSEGWETFTEGKITTMNGNGCGKRILFLGNSITRHGKAPQIDWDRDHGMAATFPELDYVHLTAEAIKKTDPNAAFCVCQAADWERSYSTGHETFHLYDKAKEFSPDVIIMRLAENIPRGGFDGEAFMRELNRFLSYLGGDKAQVILTTSFWPHPADEYIKKMADKHGYPLASLTELDADPSNRAIGLFKHSGVASHPSDKGMLKIAEKILEKYFELVQEQEVMK